MINLSDDIIVFDLFNHIELNSNDIVLISSDLSKIAKIKQGDIRFDVNLFVKSLKEKLTDGTILIPCFTDNLKDGDSFDYLHSKPTTGALSNKMMKDNSFERTKDPLHSFLVWGKHQKELVEIDGESSLGKGSVFEFLYRKNAKFLQIDVSFQDSFTFVHYIEEVLKVPYRKGYNLSINYKEKSGNTNVKKILFYTKKIGIETNLEKYEAESISAGIVKVYTYHKSTLKLFNAQTIFEYTKNYLDNKNKLHSFNFKRIVRQLIKIVLGYKSPVD